MAKKTKKAAAKKRAPTKAVLEAVRALRAEGDAHMAAGRHADADTSYTAAWSRLCNSAAACDEYGDEEAFWLAASGMDALFRSGGLEAAYDACVVIQQAFPHLAAGNPFWHLRAGQCSLAVHGEEAAREPLGMCLANLGQALLLGGIDLFSGEEPRYLALALAHVPPPDGHATWAATSRHHGVDAAIGRDRLNGAPAYLREELARRLGPGPYAAR